MPGIREICALFAAAGLGAGGTVGVQYVKPAVSRATAPAPAREPAVRQTSARRALPAQPRIVAAPAPAACIPSLGSGPGDIASLTPSLPGFTEPTHFAGPPVFTPSAFPSPGFDGPYGGGGTPGGGLPGGGGGGTPGEPLFPPLGPDPSRPVPAVPEAATWAMLVSGFGLLGLAMRRQKSPTKSPAPGTAQDSTPRDV